MVRVILCDNCHKYCDVDRPGYYWCSDKCEGAYHNRLRGRETLETRAQPKPRRPGMSVAQGWQAIGIAAESSFRRTQCRNEA